MDRYIVFNNRSCDNVFPQNNPNHFRTTLAQTLPLRGSWLVGVVELRLGEVDLQGMNSPYADILCNLADSSQCDDKLKPLLRRIDLRDAPNFEWNPPWLIPVVLRDVNEIEIHIKSVDSNSNSFLKGDTQVALLLRQYSL